MKDNRHFNKMKDMQETHDTIGSSKRILSLQTDTASRSLNIANKKEIIWKYYIKFSDFLKHNVWFAKKILLYHFYTFPNTYNKETYKNLNVRRTEKVNKMAIDAFQIFRQYIICNANVLSTSESVKI
eukprot:GHVU01197960.1.p1 GENE.GHVU01197960.1~~GHVU01197960.1.p1  ORF type:complete len:127 (+),score=13.00 GHVU01197960.1:226-606(+)